MQPHFFVRENSFLKNIKKSYLPLDEVGRRCYYHINLLEK